MTAWFYIDALGDTTCEMYAVSWEFGDSPPDPLQDYARDGDVIAMRASIQPQQWVQLSGAWTWNRNGFSKILFRCFTRNDEGTFGTYYVDEVRVR